MSGARWNIIDRPHSITLTFISRLSPRGEPSAELVALNRLLALHAGEAQALQIAQELGVNVLLTDDTSARLAAKALNVSAHGTLGILLRAVRRKQKSKEDILNILRALSIRSTLHVKRELLDEVIRRVEEF